MFYEALSFAASFIATLLATGKPRSIIILVALAILLFVLFGPFAIAGFIMAVAIRLSLPAKHQKKKK
ncbi:hypothetical protein H0O03_00420 [Candidatus Micrarchaeota archaeon]|nr:hypothetical protein [Candidatus Micrarchaeota archaeon]